MGIYNTSKIVNESSLLDQEVEASVHEASFVGAMNIVVENETNYTNMMKAVGINELMYFEQNGEEMQYEAGQLASFFGAIKAFFVKLFEKVKGLFKKFIAWMDSKIRSDKDFVNKYRSALLSVDTKDFEYKGYKYSVGAIDLSAVNDKAFSVLKAKFGLDVNVTINVETSKTDYTTKLKMSDGKDSDISDAIRGAMVGKDTVDSADFSKEVAAKLRSGEESPVDIENVNIPDLLAIIVDYKEAKKTAEKDLEGIKKSVNLLIKGLETVEKEMAKKLPDNDAKVTAAKKDARASVVRYVNKTYNAAKQVLNVLTSVNGAKLSALKADNAQAKAVCVRLLSYKPKTESSSLYEGGSLNVDFI